MESTSKDITPELIQQILKEAEKDNSIVVLPNLEVHELNGDVHVGSRLRRVKVKYTREGDTSQQSLSLFIKVEPYKGLPANVIRQPTFFIRETRMFDEILPRMSALLSKAQPDSHTDFSARVYYTLKTPSYLIAIEDLAPKGFKAHKRTNGLDLKHCLFAFRTLARFHAASVIIWSEDKGLFTVFEKSSYQQDAIRESMKKLTSELFPVIAQAVESWPEFGCIWGDRVRQRSQTLYEDLQLLQHRDESAFNVLNHGNFGVDNVMYRYCETTGELEGVMLVDFQCCSYNSPVLDMHQFIFGSASDDVRANHIDTLLREYHEELTATLKALGAPRDQTISLSQLHDEFNSKMLYGFFYTTCALPFLTIDNEIDNMQSFLSDSYLTSLRELLPLFSQSMVV